ncbi:glycosyltransferase family 4 protein [Roseateles sp. DAIF2]|uniref:glycosyltransferase family 4 protein n=1 Tax=Roseateles sp. DAIF2 TaxID=2714952 RepID=UPI0018A29F29|nr:glycosyltransferase family 1 protein [Roseateles sp. DAIF2]QPF73665.1 glycosyltransferase family 4 protein [Roseateles sp. DAIF2]
MSLQPPASTPTIYLDLTDLILWVKKHSNVTGIQRVHLNYALHSLDKGVKFIMFHGRACKRVSLVAPEVVEYMGALLSGQIEPDAARLYRLCPNARLRPWKDYQDKYRDKPAKYYWHTSASALQFYITQLLFQRRMPAPEFKPGDVLLNVGRSWIIGGYVQNIEQLKRQHGISAQILLHDVIPVGFIQKSSESRIFTQFIKESFRAFDRFFTSSEYNRGEIRKYMLEFTGAEKPIEKSLFGQHINSEGVAKAPLPAGLTPDRYLLTVGRVAESKNQARLLQAWARVIETRQDAGLQLVVVGSVNKKYQALNEILKAKPVLQERVRFVSNASDEELDALYRACHFTVFPSLIEGYGLPAAESVSYGKFCLASHAASIPEAAGEHAGFFDPLDVDDIYAKLVQFIQDQPLLREREALIRATPRMSWAEATADLLAKARRPIRAAAG